MRYLNPSIAGFVTGFTGNFQNRLTLLLESLYIDFQSLGARVGTIHFRVSLPIHQIFVVFMYSFRYVYRNLYTCAYLRH